MANAKATAASAPTPITPSLPSNMQEIGVEVEGWWNPRDPKDNKGQIDVLQGKLLGLEKMQADGRWFFQVRLSEPAICQIGSGDDAKIEELPAGSTIGVGVSYRLRPLADYVMHQGDVYVAYLGKSKNKNSARTTKRYKIGVEGKKEQFVRGSEITLFDEDDQDGGF